MDGIRTVLDPGPLMVTLAFLLWFTLKGLTLLTLPIPTLHHLPNTRLIAYLLAWIGLNPKPFLLPTPLTPPNPIQTPTTFTLLALTLGPLGILTALHPPPLILTHPLLHGWLAMLSLLLTLHFGLFQCLARFWQNRGLHVDPIMNQPTHAQSLTELWGHRWNRAFSDAAHLLILKPFARRWGFQNARTVVFALSGLIHEIVISLPAHAGYGGPTLYFLLQALGIRAQGTTLAHQLRLDQGWRGRFVTAAFALTPLPLLFHKPFVTQVILPLFGHPHPSPQI